MRLLPQPKGSPRYIIRSQAEPEREYTAEASELRRVSAWAMSLEKESPRLIRRESEGFLQAYFSM